MRKTENVSLSIKGTTYLEYLLYTIIILICLTPPIRLIPNFAAIRIEELLLVLLIYVIIKKNGFNFIYQKDIVSVVFLMMFVFTLGSIIVAITLFRYSFNYRDFLELVKIIKYFTVYKFVKSLTIGEEQLIKVSNILDFIIIVVFAFNVMQAFNILNINAWLTPIYAPPHHLAAVRIHGRAVGTFLNPNYMGTFAMITIIFKFFQLINYKGKDIKKLAFIILMILFSEMSLIYSISRTSIFASIIVFFVLLAFNLKRIRNVFGRLVITILLMALLFGLTPGNYFFVRILDGLNISSSVSFQRRVEIWSDQFDLDNYDNIDNLDGRQPSITKTGWGENNIYISNARNSVMTAMRIIIGQGPRKSGEAVYLDNEYLLIFKRYGIIGVGLYLVLFFGIILKGIRQYKGTKCKYGHLIISITIGVLIINLTGGTFLNLQLFPFFILLVGLFDNQNNNYQNKICLT